MGVFDFFKKKKNPNKTDKPIDKQNETKKEDIYKMIFERMSQMPPSELFANGAVFDISLFARSNYLKAAESSNAVGVLQTFIDSFALFIDHPEVVKIPPQVINMDKMDTDPGMWNADVFRLKREGSYACLLFMPIQNEVLSARIVGIIFNDNDDGYYYCMLNKDGEKYSDVFRNIRGRLPQKIGEVKGFGFELMQDFLNCIVKEYENSVS